MTTADGLPSQIVLVGAGHAHVQVLKSFAERHPSNVRLTVVTKEVEAPYSGMLPGFVAGHYEHHDIHIDVPRLARSAGAHLIHGEAVGIDRARRQLSISGCPPVSYDLLSIDVGITPDISGIAGALEHAIAVKPVSTFARRWSDLSARAARPNGPRAVVVAGGGAAGVEIVLAVAHRLRAEAARAGVDPSSFSFTLVSGPGLLATHGVLARSLTRRALSRRGVVLVDGKFVVEVTADHAVLDDGTRLATDAVLLTTKAAPARWLAQSGLPCANDGFLAVRPTLQLIDDDDVFAAGDCATVVAYPRPKAGVFAVRQGPPLTENLRLRARGLPVRPFVPQERFLSILALGDKDAIAARGAVAVGGRWVWRWKDRIDRSFMSRFRT